MSELTLPSKKSEFRARITRAAIALFSRQMYHGTSTREIARLADVSEVTLFRHFEHKEEIFWAALASSLSEIKPRLSLLAAAAKHETPEVVLPQIISLFVDTAAFSPELVRLVAVAFLEVGGKAEEICREHLAPLFVSINSYLELNIREGRVRNLDPTIVTVAIALSGLAQPQLARICGGATASKLERRQMIQSFTSFWMNALLSSPAEGRMVKD